MPRAAQGSPEKGRRQRGLLRGAEETGSDVRGRKGWSLAASSVNGRSSATPGRGEVGVRVGAWRPPISASHLTEEGSKATAMTSLRRTSPVSGSNLRGPYFCRTWVEVFFYRLLCQSPLPAASGQPARARLGAVRREHLRNARFFPLSFPSGKLLSAGRSPERNPDSGRGFPPAG